jgi:hypothetical protein
VDAARLTVPRPLGRLGQAAALVAALAWLTLFSAARSRQRSRASSWRPLTVQIFMQQLRLARVSIREAILPASSDT